MLNQLQHRLNCLIISVPTKQIHDSLYFFFSFFFVGGGGCFFCFFLEHTKRSLEELFVCWSFADCVAEYSWDKLHTWEHSQDGTKMNSSEGQYTRQIKSRPHSFSGMRGCRYTKWLVREKLLSLKMMKRTLMLSGTACFLFFIFFFPWCWFSNICLWKYGSVQGCVTVYTGIESAWINENYFNKLSIMRNSVGG